MDEHTAPVSLVVVHNSDAPEIYTLSLHDALPISLAHDNVVRAEDRHDVGDHVTAGHIVERAHMNEGRGANHMGDRKSTRLNSSHSSISYAVFCLKKKKRDVDDSAETRACMTGDGR